MFLRYDKKYKNFIPLYNQYIIERTYNCGIVLIWFSIVSLIYFIFQDIFIVKNLTFASLRVIYILPLIFYIIFRDNFLKTSKNLFILSHTLLLLSAALMICAINFYVVLNFNYDLYSFYATSTAYTVISFCILIFSEASRKYYFYTAILPLIALIILILIFKPGFNLSYYSNHIFLVFATYVFSIYYENYYFNSFVNNILDKKIKDKLEIEIKNQTKLNDELKKTIHKNTMLNKKLLNQITFDNLTGAYKSEKGIELIKNDIEICKKNNGHLIIGYIDIDNLKSINDSYGHFEGDNLIKTIIKKIKKSLPNNDYIIRVGGDEFIIAFHNCDFDFVEKFITNIRNELSKIDKISKYKYTFSIGLAKYDGIKIKCINSLIKKADKNMYNEKIGKRA